MTTENRQQIQELLNIYCDNFSSQAKAANSLKAVSEATLINIRKGNWDSITDEMFRKVGKQVGFSNKDIWKIVPTTNYKTLTALFDDAKEYGNNYGIVAGPGCSKTISAEEFSRTHKNVYHLECSEYWNRKEFLSRLLQRMGKEHTGSVSNMMDLIVETLLRQEEPLIIIDEADKLNDNVLYFFITLCNMLKNKCAIVIMATDYLAKRINNGCRLNKKGYNEIFSRIGRRFIHLKQSTEAEVFEICKANGVNQRLDQTKIFNEFEGDLRRVERAIHKVRKDAERLAV